MRPGTSGNLSAGPREKPFAVLTGVSFLLPIIALALVIAAVGAAESASDEGTIPERMQTPVPDDPATPTSRPDPTRNGLQRREVRVGLYENKPKIHTDETGAAAGIFADILKEIARREGWQLRYVPCEWFDCLEGLKNGQLDLMPDVAFSAERDEPFDFHAEEVISSWSAVYARDADQINRITDLDGRRIAVVKGSIQQTSLEQMVSGFGFEVDLVEARSFEEAYRLAANGSADAVVTNHFSGDYFHEEYGLAKTSIVFNPVSLYFAAASGANADLLAAIDGQLRAMKAEPGSAYYRALARWMEQPPQVRLVVPRYLIWLIGSTSGLLVLASALILLFRWQLGVRTRHLADANALLRNSEKKFSDLFHQHAAVKMLVDPDTGAIVEANRAAEEFYGWSGEQLRQMRIQDIHTLPPEQVAAEMEKAKNLQRIHFELRHRLADGSIRDVAVFTSRIDIQGKTLLHSIVHDITERRRLEDQLRQAQKMEAVGQLAGGMAHDYNNMLNVIVGYTELALERMDPGDPLCDDLKEVLRAGKRSIDMTRQLLAFARRQTASPRALDLNETVEEMLKMLRPLVGAGVELAWVPAADLWPVRIDPGQVDQILANLCVNARDAVGGVGQVIIETRNATFEAADCAGHPGFSPGEYVLLAVRDNGCGMDQATLGRVFEPFFTTKGVGRGTGLGLSTVYGIVRQNHGFIGVDSEPGKGTTFRLYLPRHQGKADTIVREGAEELAQGRGETVLLVEDDPAIRKLTRRMLESLGYQVLEADTPGNAERLADEHGDGIDLLMTDAVMPELNGRDLADRLHARHPALRTLFVSGYAADVIARQGILDEHVRFLQKPFSVRELARKVRESLGE